MQLPKCIDVKLYPFDDLSEESKDKAIQFSLGKSGSISSVLNFDFRSKVLAYLRIYDTRSAVNECYPVTIETLKEMRNEIDKIIKSTEK